MNIYKKWKIVDQAKLFCRLGLLLERGYSLTTALEFIMLNEANDRKRDFQLILEMLTQGTPLYSVFNSFQFSNEGLSYIYFAETYGDLADGFLNAGKMLEKKEDYKRKIGKLIRYPVFLAFFIGILFSMMQKILIPQFIQLYESMNLPPSNILLFISFLESSTPLFIFICCFFLLIPISYYFFAFRKKPPISKQILLCKIPIIRFFVRKYNTYFFSFHFGNLLGSGFAINDAIKVFNEQNHSMFYKAEASRIRMLLLEGERLENILRATSYYERELATVIVHGQANSILSDELLVYSKLILEEAEDTFQFWMSVFQPAIIIFLGIGVVLMYLAVMLPIFRMIQTL